MKKLTSLLNQFKEFAMQGNVIDLAVGLTVGAAFKDIVTSLVNNIIMPPIGLILGRVNFNDLYLNLSNQKFGSLTEAKDAGAPVIAYGAFFNSIISFIIIAFTIFILIKFSNRLKAELVKKEEKKIDPKEKRCPFCFSKIHIKATRCPFCTSKLEE